MTGVALFAASVAAYAGIPLLLAIRRTPFQVLLLYTHIAAVLTLGGLLGAVYVLPVWGDVALLAGQVSYGGFMFTTLLTVIVGRDLQVVRNIVMLTITVNVLVFLLFALTHRALSEGRVPNPLGVEAEVFDQSLRVVGLGGALIILELLALLALLELAKRRLRGWPMAPVYVLGFVGTLTLDGVLFPAIVLRPQGGLGEVLADSVLSKLVLATAFAVPLALFLAVYSRVVQRYEATPLRLGELVPTRNAPVWERLRQQEAELEERTAEAGRATATVSRILDAATNTMLIATDADHRVTHFNRGAEQLLGYSAAEVVGRSMVNVGDPDELARHAEELGVPADLRELVPVLARDGGRRDWVLRAKSGERLLLSLSFTEIRDGGELIGYLCAGEDVTQRVRTQAALSDALRRELESVARLEEADRLKDEVVSTISHELRTPIASIRGYAEMVADGELGPVTSQQTAALTKVLRNTTRLSALIDDLLHLDRAQSGALGVTRVRTDLGHVAREATDALEQLALGRVLDLVVRTPGRPVWVRGDPGALERVVLNLGGNAIKFTPDGGSVTVTVEESGEQAVLSVTDTGIGIAEEEQRFILNRFFRASEAYRSAIPGTGLGLSVVDAIVAQHEGRLHISSTLGRGTTVTVRLPLLTEDEPDGGQDEPDEHSDGSRDDPVGRAR